MLLCQLVGAIFKTPTLIHKMQKSGVRVQGVTLGVTSRVLNGGSWILFCYCHVIIVVLLCCWLSLHWSGSKILRPDPVKMPQGFQTIKMWFGDKDQPPEVPH